jgi:DNA-3-methyladenine glycosylase II
MRKAPGYWQNACEELSRADPVLEKLISVHKEDVLQGSGEALRTLVNAVVGQQISVSAAESIWGRLCSLVPEMNPKNLLSAEEAALRQTGLSRRKVEYIRGIAEAFFEDKLNEEKLDAMADAEVKKQLCSLRGIGPWTADMFLIFHLNRPDILPVEDIGLVNAASRLYRWSDLPDRKRQQERLLEHAESWRPWRTVATWYIWRDLDAEPVIY